MFLLSWGALSGLDLGWLLQLCASRRLSLVLEPPLWSLTLLCQVEETVAVLPWPSLEPVCLGAPWYLSCFANLLRFLSAP